MDEITVTVRALVVAYGLNLLGALAILILGWWLAGLLSRMLRRLLRRTDITESLIGFFGSLVYYALLVFAVVAALGRAGVETTSFIAVLGAAGLAIGLALEGALANFAAGVLILLFRPYRVGDRVEIAGKFGVVDQILVFNTILVTPDKKTIIVPNAQVTSDTITNYTTLGYLRLNLIFGIGYGDDILHAKRILQEILAEDEYVLPSPPPEVGVHELADSSVNFAVWPFVAVDDYWPATFSLTEKVKLRFDAEGISIPFPQRDVHLFSAPE